MTSERGSKDELKDGRRGRRSKLNERQSPEGVRQRQREERRKKAVRVRVWMEG